ncbi:putative Ig domain-containing protein [Paractinoplanes brasiliensis]|uniref:Prepilin-type N-terminal cleavage/methylation domain-containing protein n=1 Tax=Paractinoplanes brasiliensis TaxID=52695 RepID=A0A4R6J7V4_9ACTN|nr:putative Ig domain-containing protein [Actinoplanes brasiliensis]TDO31609.1 prepilin-type N-terminal cleavage/methylation domain-containing protein [Actinoplanes brasiliensis]GID31008.1 hypothetical protein Abr02nite_59910 [Actinoplanes brasiliensis]
MRGKDHGRASGTGDQGFTLVEVLVALAVLSITLLAATPFFVGSLQSVNKQRTRQAAIQLANTTMEQVRGLKGSSLLSGHGQQAGEQQFAAAPAVVKPYLATMQVERDADSTVAPTDGADAPISTAAQVTVVEGTPYTRMVYVGACEVYLIPTSSGACVYPLGKPKAPADQTKILKFFRAVVLVSWPDTSCPQTPGICQYVASTLVSRAPEPNFDIKRPSPTVLTAAAVFYRGIPVSFQLEARGGQLPNTWTIAQLPAGLTMNGAGLITGTPAAAGVTPLVSTTVTDRLNRSDSSFITFTVVLPPTVTPPTTPGNHVGEAVSLPVTAANGVGPYVFTAAGLAPGLSIDAATGQITGTVTTAGTYATTITATDQNGVAGTGSYSHVVLPAVALGPLTDRTIDLGDKLTLTATATGGDGKYTFNASGLPPGVSMNKNGMINDTVSISGRFLPTISVTDSLGGTGGVASQRIVLLVNPTAGSLTFTSPSPAAPDRSTPRGTPASLPLTTNGGLLGLNPLIAVTGLPPGLTFNPVTGVISGTPNTADTYVVTATATAVAATTVLTFVWTIT